MAPIIQFKRGLFENLPSLRAGEPGITTDRSDLFVGGADGNKFYGSHRYWKREVAATSSAELKLVDAGGDVGVSLRSPTNAGVGITYTLPVTGSTGHYLKLGTNGDLEWASVSEGASFDNATLNNTTFTGISTFSGAIDANAGLDVTGGSTFDNINVTGVGTIGGLLDANGGLDVFGHTELDDLNVSGIATFSSAIDGDLLGNAGTATSLSTARDFSVSGDVATSSAVSFDGTGNVDLVVTLSNTFSANTSGIITATGGFVGDLTGTASTATRATLVDTTATSTDATYYIPFVANSNSTTSETVRVDSGISYNPSSNTLDVPNLETGSIKASDGTSAITITDVTGNVSFASTVTITGNLQVLGSTTTINTETLLVKDSVIDIGLIDDGNGNLVEPDSATATDLALVFHYYDTASKQSSLYWDHDNANGERFVLASQLTGHTVGTATTSVEALAYAALEVGSLWINNACSGGSQEVIGCNDNSELALMNIVVDGGFFE